MLNLLRAVPIAWWAVAALSVSLGIQSVRLAWSQSDVAGLRLEIVEAVAEGERATREALAVAAERERVERARLQADADVASAKARADADAARRRMSVLQRQVEELSDETVDAWRVAPVPASIGRLLSEGNH